MESFDVEVIEIRSEVVKRKVRASLTKASSFCVCVCTPVCVGVHACMCMYVVIGNTFKTIHQQNPQLPITLKGEGFQLISLSNLLISPHPPPLCTLPPPSLPLSPPFLWVGAPAWHPGTVALHSWWLWPGASESKLLCQDLSDSEGILKWKCNVSIGSWEKTSSARPSGKSEAGEEQVEEPQLFRLITFTPKRSEKSPTATRSNSPTFLVY